MNYERILVRAANWLGDAVMSLPALHAIRARFPSAYIAIVAKPWVAGLYGRESFCNDLIPYNSRKGWGQWSAKWAIASDLRSRHFDCAILLQNAFEAAALTWLARIPARIGYNRDGRGLLLTNAVAVPRKGEIPAHQRFYYLELLRRAGLIEGYSPDAAIQLRGAAAAAEAGRQRLPGRVIGVSPGAAYGSAKRWIPERFADAAVQIARELNVSVAVFGSKEEQSICDTVAEAIGSHGVPVENFGGRTTLEEFIEVVAACELYLSNDSGPMHIASALGVPSIAIFGPTDEHATGPAGSKSRVVREPVECSPCLLRECPIDHRCMTRVEASRVVDVALELLK